MKFMITLMVLVKSVPLSSVAQCNYYPKMMLLHIHFVKRGQAEEEGGSWGRAAWHLKWASLPHTIC